MKTNKNIYMLFLPFCLLIQQLVFAQDSVPVKVHHAEPLYMDLVRDLGARKGEKEINVAGDFLSLNGHKEYVYLAEYEFAPINRLGLEIETDFSFYKGDNPEVIKGGKFDALRLSAQYSFYVSKEQATTLAVVYTQLFEFNEFNKMKNDHFLTGLAYNPSFIAAKNFKDRYHLLLYTGPVFEKLLKENDTSFKWSINTSFHYTLPNSGHFIGVEVNQMASKNKLETTVRPQVKIQLNEEFAVGLVTGFPIHNKEESFSSFFRLIYVL